MIEIFVWYDRKTPLLFCWRKIPGWAENEEEEAAYYFLGGANYPEILDYNVEDNEIKTIIIHHISYETEVNWFFVLLFKSRDFS